MFTDPIADYLTRVRNSQAAGHKVVDVPSSNTFTATLSGNNMRPLEFNTELLTNDKSGANKKLDAPRDIAPTPAARLERTTTPAA